MSELDELMKIARLYNEESRILAVEKKVDRLGQHIKNVMIALLFHLVIYLLILCRIQSLTNPILFLVTILCCFSPLQVYFYFSRRISSHTKLAAYFIYVYTPDKIVSLLEDRDLIQQIQTTIPPSLHERGERLEWVAQKMRIFQ